MLRLFCKHRFTSKMFVLVDCQTGRQSGFATVHTCGKCGKESITMSRRELSND